MTYHTAALPPNSCVPIANGPFRDPKGRSYPHAKYWTHRWRIDINNSHEILPIQSRWGNQCIWHIIRRYYYQIAAAQWRMVHFGTPGVSPIHTPNRRGPNGGWSISGPQRSVLSTLQILDLSMKDWYQYQPCNLTYRVPLRKLMHMTYHTTVLLPNRRGPNGGWSISGPQRSVLSTLQILDLSMKDWYQYQLCNLTYRVPLRQSMHMTYHTTALLPNSCGPMADGLFRNPRGQSYPHPKYWTHRWRIDINIGRAISPIVSS